MLIPFDFMHNFPSIKEIRDYRKSKENKIEKERDKIYKKFDKKIDKYIHDYIFKHIKLCMLEDKSYIEIFIKNEAEYLYNKIVDFNYTRYYYLSYDRKEQINKRTSEAIVKILYELLEKGYKISYYKNNYGSSDFINFDNSYKYDPYIFVFKIEIY